ncbi:S-phase kinase-associated protein 1 [Taenia solium]|eukprot:TsM_000400800 transcript=TsM_000400800 gene=TsM_000400800
MPVKLVTADNVVFDVDLEIARQSVMISDILDDVGPEAAEDDEPIPLRHVNADILKKVLQWCTHHKDDDTQQDQDEDSELRTDDIPDWDREFLQVDQKTLLEILMAANYLEIEGLLDMCCKSVANMIKGMKIEELRKTFNIKSDFTPQEEEQIRRENEWCGKR